MSSQFDLISDHSKERLKEIPRDVLLITNLKMLFLEGNRLQSLPDDIFYKLPKLMWLDVRNNQLTGFPKSVAYHTHLENLLLTNNKIEELPNELGLVPNLKVLQVADNPLVYPVRKIVKEGTKAIKKYLKQQYESTRPKTPVVFRSRTPTEDKERAEEKVLRVIDEYSKPSLPPQAHGTIPSRSSSFARKKERRHHHERSPTSQQSIKKEALEPRCSPKEIISTNEVDRAASPIPKEVIKTEKKKQESSVSPIKVVEPRPTSPKDKVRKVNERCQSPKETVSRAQQEPPSLITQEINTDTHLFQQNQKIKPATTAGYAQHQQGVQSQSPPQNIKVFKMQMNESGESPRQMINREFQNMQNIMRNPRGVKEHIGNVPYNVAKKISDPRMLQSTLRARGMASPIAKSADESVKIVHNIQKQGSKISLKSYFSSTGSKKAKVVQRNLKEGWMNKLRILLEDQERILQQERNLKALSSWRQRHHESGKTSMNSGRVASPSPPPYATDPEYSRIPNRDELTRQLQAFLNQLNLPRNKRNDIPILNIEKLLIDMEEQLREMQNTHSSGHHSPRTDIDQAEKQIRAIMDIHKKLLDLKAANEYT